jgi:amidase
MPLHWNAAGLPIGTQFVARLGEDALLFRLAGQMERAQPWFDRVANDAASQAPTHAVRAA